MSTSGSYAPLLPLIVSRVRRSLVARSYRFESSDVSSSRQLLIDVSVIVRHDARTGIQRVVRALLGQLMTACDPDISVVPVFATRNHGYCRAIFRSDGRLVSAYTNPRVLQTVNVERGDIFLGLDLAAHILPTVETDLARWRRQGVSVNIMVYDLLPLLQPAWFPSSTVRNFRRWIGVLARQADRCICISNTVADSLVPVIKSQQRRAGPEILTIPLGADLEKSFPSQGLPSNIEQIRNWLTNHRALLLVGTIEPRKGHDKVLAAVTHLWEQSVSSDVALLIVGRPGWKTEALQSRLRLHPELGKRLFWLENVTDELLTELYWGTSGLIAASHAEGFGLPLIEALAHGTPVLARDLRVFREIGGPLFDYFEDDSSEALAARIGQWLNHPRRPSPEAVARLPRWADSANELAHHLGAASPALSDPK